MDLSWERMVYRETGNITWDIALESSDVWVTQQQGKEEYLYQALVSIVTNFKIWLITLVSDCEDWPCYYSDLYG